MPKMGSVRTVHGQTEIYVGNWIPYPQQASDLVALAYDHGWAVDDGLPDLKLKDDGYPFIRVLIARPAGVMARSLVLASPAYQFHITWNASSTEWKLGTIYVKSDQEAWKDTTFRDVRTKIVKFAVKLPRLYVSANS
jgi:hypothetical protein